MQLREVVRPFIWSRVGDGKGTSAWFDKWADECPLINFISPRSIASAGFTLQNNVSDIYRDGVWKWPVAWFDLFPVLISLPDIQLSPNAKDTLMWRVADVVHPFSSKVVWDTIRSKKEEVLWYGAVWFSKMIPRHASLMWLIMKRKLRTQDIMMTWASGGNMNYNLVCCSLCNQGPDSHDHLFFHCSFSSQVWHGVRHLAQMSNISSNWEDILDWLVSRSSSNSAKSVIGKLLVAATAYFIWQERNNRLFSKEVRSVEQLQDIVATTIRLKLVTLRFKNTIQVGRFIEAWNLPRDLVVHDYQRRG